MTRADTVLDHLRRAVHGGAWHGHSLREALAGVGPEAARARPVPAEHSIWEHVLHTAAWLAAARRRLGGEAVELGPHEDWPGPGDATPSGWEEAIGTVVGEHRRLEEAVRSAPEGILDDQVPGRDYSFEFMLLGLSQHVAYHTGKIGVLKRAAEASGGRGAVRSRSAPVE